MCLCVCVCMCVCAFDMWVYLRGLAGALCFGAPHSNEGSRLFVVVSFHTRLDESVCCGVKTKAGSKLLFCEHHAIDVWLDADFGFAP